MTTRHVASSTIRLEFTRFAAFSMDYLSALSTGRLDFQEFSVLAALTLLAKAAGDNGIVHTSPAALAAQFRGLVKSTAQDVFQRLESKGWIRRFWHEGMKGPYPIAIHGYVLPRTHTRLDALRTQDWRHPATVSWQSTNGGGETADENTDHTNHGSTQGSTHGRTDGSTHAATDDPTDQPTEDPTPSMYEGEGELPPPSPNAHQGGSGSRGRLRGAGVHAPDGDALWSLWRTLTAEKGVPGTERWSSEYEKVFSSLVTLAAGDLSTCEETIRAYFADNEEFIQKNGWSIGVFKARMRGYLIESPSRGSPQPAAEAQPPPPSGPPATPEEAAKFAAEFTNRSQPRKEGA